MMSLRPQIKFHLTVVQNRTQHHIICIFPVFVFLLLCECNCNLQWEPPSHLHPRLGLSLVALARYLTCSMSRCMLKAHTQNTFQLIQPHYISKGKIAPTLECTLSCNVWGIEVKLHEFLTSTSNRDFTGPCIRARRGVLNRGISSRDWV